MVCWDRVFKETFVPSSAAYLVDQRAEPRPFGKASDIGAYEVTSTPVTNIFEAFARTSQLDLFFYSAPFEKYEFLSSSNLIHWTPFLTNTIDNLGRVLLSVPLVPENGMRVFRTRQVASD